MTLHQPGRSNREQQLNSILQTVADAILIVDEDGVVRYANAATERVFGMPLENMIGNSFGLPVVSDETTEVDIVQPGGSIVSAELRSTEIIWENRRAYVAAIRDITVRKKAMENAQQLLREQLARAQAEENERRARFLADAANALSSSLDYAVTLNELAQVCSEYYADWCIIDVTENGAGLKRVAVAQRDAEQALLARQLAEIDPGQQLLPNQAEVLRTGQPSLTNDFRLTSGDERYQRIINAIAPSAALVVPLASRGRILGSMVFLAAQSGRRYNAADLNIVSELGRYAATAVDNSRLFQEAQRGNEAKANFLAIMSHELRTPLNAIIGYAGLLTMGVPEPIPDTAIRYVERIRDSGRHLLGLIEEILLFSRTEAGHEQPRLERVSLHEVLDSVSAIIEPLARAKALDFRMVGPDADYRLHTDPGRLRQILLNLLSNAIKFTPGGHIELEVVRADPWTHFHVKDSGIGIAPEHLDRIFEPFWQAEQSRTRRAEGAGLGLSVARRLAQLLGGNLMVQSTANLGSTFTLQLPTEGPGVHE